MGIKSEKVYQNYLKSLRKTDDSSVETTPKIINQWFLDFLKNKGCKKILDVGFGTGMFMKQAKNDSFDIDGLETNGEFIKEGLKMGLRVKRGDAAKIPFPSSSFEGVHCSHVIEHISDPASAFLEFYRVLRKGGWLLLSTPRFNKLFYDDWTHLRPLTKRALEKLALASGFKRINAVTLHLPFLVKYYHFLPVRWLNKVFSGGILAKFLTWFAENFLGYQRSVFLLTAQK